jgi:SET domain-containing protein
MRYYGFKVHFTCRRIFHFFYRKDEDKWEKENEEKKKIITLIKKLRKKYNIVTEI